MHSHLKSLQQKHRSDFMYKVVKKFADLQDERYLYKVGDVYPRDGYTPTDERIEELSSSKNKQNTPLIKKVTSRRKKKEN